MSCAPASLDSAIALRWTPEAASPIEPQRACQWLLRQLRRHLRLEARWLRGHGLLCPGHWGGHQLMSAAAPV